MNKCTRDSHYPWTKKWGALQEAGALCRFATGHPPTPVSIRNREVIPGLFLSRTLANDQLDQGVRLDAASALVTAGRSETGVVSFLDEWH
jgi:hypothetical protein